MSDIPELKTFLRLSADERYLVARDSFQGSVMRLAAGYEANPAEREELIQDIHLQLWRSLERFDGRCSLKTWVYRVAHNVGADHVARTSRRRDRVGIEELDQQNLRGDGPSPEEQVADRSDLGRLLEIVRRLNQIDRQVTLLYLEGEDNAEIARVTGCSNGAISTRLHRIRTLLAQRLDGRKPK